MLMTAIREGQAIAVGFRCSPANVIWAFDHGLQARRRTCASSEMNDEVVALAGVAAQPMRNLIWLMDDPGRS